MTIQDAPSHEQTPGPRVERTSYDSIHHSTVRVYTPRTRAELKEILRSLAAAGDGRRITIAAGNQALDAQSLGDHLVIQLGGAELGHIGEPQRDDQGYFVTLGTAAAWGDVLTALSARGLMPWSMVTTSHATVGGTMAADCLSRSSPLTGREGVHVRRFAMITVDGREIECRRDDPDPERRLLFRAVIGGFGYLGVVTEVTLDLRPPPPGWEPGRTIQVATRADKYRLGEIFGGTWEGFLPWLRERAAAADLTGESGSLIDRFLDAWRPHEPSATTPWDAVSSAAWFTLTGTDALLFRSRYVLDRELHPLPIYRPSSRLMDVATMASVNPALAELSEGALFTFNPSGVYVDDLADFTWFMENQITPAKAAALAAGWRLDTVEQTFVLPATPGPDDRAGVGPTTRFLEQLRPILFGGSTLPAPLQPMRPTLIDVLYLPADDFILSSTRGLAGFAVTLAFNERNEDGWDTLQARLEALSRACHDLGGRVHLVKDVVAEQPVLEAMYGGAFAEFLALKRAYDPHGVLENAFFDRIFGTRSRWGGPGPPQTP